jgi:hypothetical protein
MATTYMQGREIRDDAPAEMVQLPMRDAVAAHDREADVEAPTPRPDVTADTPGDPTPLADTAPASGRRRFDTPAKATAPKKAAAPKAAATKTRR